MRDSESPRCEMRDCEIARCEVRDCEMRDCEMRSARCEIARLRGGLEVRFVVGPVEDALLGDVEEADGDEGEVDEPLPEAEEARAGDGGETAVDDGPGENEDGFDVEED